MKKESDRWMVVLPPEGAARQVGLETWNALRAALPPERCKLFDSKAYLDGFDRLLKDPANDMVVDLSNQALVVQCLDFGATHLLVLALSPVTAFTVTLLGRHGIVTLHWFYEDFRQAKYWREVLPAYRHFLAIQRGPVEALCRETGVGFHYLPTATSMPTDIPPVAWSSRKTSAAFIGFPSPYRIRVLEALASAGIPLRIAGSGWVKYRGILDPHLASRNWTGPELSRQLLSDAKMGLHIPTEDPAEDRGNSHVSPRLFDVLAAGCVLVCEEAPLIRETLRGFHYREFRGADEAVEAARDALAEAPLPSALESNLALAGESHALKNRVGYLLDLT